MLYQLGERYEGDIALNDSPDNLNAIGLISAYQTVLNRAKKLSIEGTPPIDYAPVNNAILLVASRLADFYTLLGNEAYGDAADPMIGFGTGDGTYGSLAPAIFAFQNQLDSLLEEELVLLRGRDDGQATVVGRPIYNRLFWNFTTGEGGVRLPDQLQHHRSGPQRRHRRGRRQGALPAGARRRLGPLPDRDDHLLRAAAAPVLHLDPAAGGGDGGRRAGAGGLPRRAQVRQGRRRQGQDGRRDRRPDLPPELRRGSRRPVAGLQGHRHGDAPGAWPSGAAAPDRAPTSTGWSATPSCRPRTSTPSTSASSGSTASTSTSWTRSRASSPRCRRRSTRPTGGSIRSAWPRTSCRSTSTRRCSIR